MISLAIDLHAHLCSYNHRDHYTPTKTTNFKVFDSHGHLCRDSHEQKTSHSAVQVDYRT